MPFQDPIAAWDVADVSNWLLALGLARVVKACKEASADGLTILQILEPQDKEERARLVNALGLHPEELARILRAGKACRRRDIMRNWLEGSKVGGGTVAEGETRKEAGAAAAAAATAAAAAEATRIATASQ